MQKRAFQKDKSDKKEPEAETEESAFMVGLLVSYYDGGTRYGHITELDIDDDGALACRIQPIGAKGKTLRTVLYPSSQLKIEGIK